MSRQKNKDDDFGYIFSNEKLREFKGISIKALLQWLEEANSFIKKALGFKKRAFLMRGLMGWNEEKVITTNILLFSFF